MEHIYSRQAVLIVDGLSGVSPADFGVRFRSLLPCEVQSRTFIYQHFTSPQLTSDAAKLIATAEHLTRFIQAFDQTHDVQILTHSFGCYLYLLATSMHKSNFNVRSVDFVEPSFDAPTIARNLGLAFKCEPSKSQYNYQTKTLSQDHHHPISFYSFRNTSLSITLSNYLTEQRAKDSLLVIEGGDHNFHNPASMQFLISKLPHITQPSKSA